MPQRRSSDLPTTHELPLVSIITPSYNQAPFIRETLESVAAQDYPRIEHIVYDGGSTDGTVDIIRGWAEDHPVVWRSERDGGQADAISQAASAATGDIIAWLNSDDIYLDSRVVSDIVEVFRNGAAIVTGGGWYLDEHGQRQELIPVFPERVGFDALRHVDWILQPATFVRRDLFLSCPIDTSLHFAFDWDLFIRLTRKASPQPIFRELAGYRRHGEGKTVSGGLRRQRELLEVTRRYNPRLAGRTLLLDAVVAGHALAERLPGPIKSKVVGLLTRIAVISQRFTNGRGIQY